MVRVMSSPGDPAVSSGPDDVNLIAGAVADAEDDSQMVIDPGLSIVEVIGRPQGSKNEAGDGVTM